ncbi:MAG: DNA methyltransferase [Candidatus Poribacteria bacterium]|nr:DNA methyltransferase [Candidatus Poribacteria bacterium]
MLTEPGDFVVDPFGGSCVTGEVCERIKRRWVCIELVEDYCKAAIGRFIRDSMETSQSTVKPRAPSNYYRIPRPGIMWGREHTDELAKDGGRSRPTKIRKGSGRRTRKVSHSDIEQNEKTPAATLPLFSKEK